MTPAAAIAALADVDADLAANYAPLRSLEPGRPRASTLVEILGDRLADGAPGLIAAFARGTIEFVRAQAESFPDNLLWDLDLPLVTWWKGALAATDPAAFASAHLGLASELHRLFGRGTVLRFRYAHDFIYGFDWAKWVGRDPSTRADVGPFDRVFLEAMRTRAHELVDIVAAGTDAKYPALPQSTPRNPFPFSREPAAELSIHRALADAGQIPAPAWQTEAKVAWAQPWAAWREQAAARLGFATHEAPRKDQA